MDLRTPGLRSLLRRTKLVDTYTGSRTFSVSAAKFEGMARRAGLRCISQELVNWYSPRLSDCLSMFTPNGSRWSRPNRIRHNPDFIGEARRIRETGMPGDARFVLERGHIAKPAPIGQ